jgi:hypothetical protein
MRYQAVEACERLEENWAISEPAGFLKRRGLGNEALV